MTPETSMHVGLATTLSAVVSEDMVRVFAEITGDDAAHHLDAAFAASSALERPVAHGVLLLGLVSTASTRVLESVTGHFVSTGYDGVRFRRPLYVGDTAEVRYEITQVEDEGRRSTATFSIRDSAGTECVVGRHQMRRIEKPGT